MESKPCYWCRHFGNRAKTLKRLLTRPRALSKHFWVIFVIHIFTYNNKINPHTLIGQSAMVYCAGKSMEKVVRLQNYILYKSNRSHFLWVYWGNNPLGMFGRTVKKFVNHSPVALDLNTFFSVVPNIARGLLPL